MSPPFRITTFSTSLTNLTAHLPQSRDYSCYVSRPIPAPPPLWLQKHNLSTRTRLRAASPTCDESIGSLTLSAPEAGDFVELVQLYQHLGIIWVRVFSIQQQELFLHPEDGGITVFQSVTCMPLYQGTVCHYTRGLYAIIPGDCMPLYQGTVCHCTRGLYAIIPGHCMPLYQGTVCHCTRGLYAIVPGDCMPLYQGTVCHCTRGLYAIIRGDCMPLYQGTVCHYARGLYAIMPGDCMPLCQGTVCHYTRGL